METKIGVYSKGFLSRGDFGGFFPAGILIWAVLFLGCEPLATSFEEVEDAVLYEATETLTPPMRAERVLVMTWNIRFGAGRIGWFGDSCGDRVIMSEGEVVTHLQALVEYLDRVDPDIVLLQEVDVGSKRSAYVDQLQWILDRSSLNYGAFASVWKVQYIPSDGLGRMDEGVAVLSKWKITDAQRIALPRRGDQDALTRYFYLRWNILRVKVDLPDHDLFYVLNTHTTAFAADNTKKMQIDRFKQELQTLNGMAGVLFVAGGDLNEIPPESDSTDYCEEDRCPEDDPDSCPDGSDFTGEIQWLRDLYDSFTPAVSLAAYHANNPRHFTHNRVDPLRATVPSWNRKLDYLFSNGQWVSGSDSTHQDTYILSDHAPVSARIMVRQ